VVPTSYRKRIYQRTKQILWGPIEVIAAVLGILVILSRPVMDYLLRLWEGLPWWAGALLLGALLSYALLRAGYELWQEEKEAHDRAEAQTKQAQQERDKLKLQNEELIAESENRPDPLPDTLEEWEKVAPPVPVRNRTYRNDRVELDGFYYDACVFDNCTFSFKGTKPFTVVASCRIEGHHNIDAPAPQAMAILRFLKSFDGIPGTEYRDPVDGGLLD
jgi:hypothetical protein